MTFGTSEVKSLKTLFSAFVLLSVCTTLNKIGCTSEVKSLKTLFSAFVLLSVCTIFAQRLKSILV